VSDNIKNSLLSFSCKRNQAGFSIVELNIAITVAAVMSIAFLTIFTSFLASTTRTNASIDMTAKSQVLLRSLVEELRYSAGVRDSNTIDDPNVSGSPPGEWVTSNANTVLITAVPAEDSTGAYIINTDTGSPYLNEYVYYKNGSVLYKRTLAHPLATGNTSKTSCPVGTPTCPADRKLIETLDNMTFVLYDQDNEVAAASANARSIQINLFLKDRSFGQDLRFDNTVRVTLRNVF
jgi:Tfp pilus assembly protein PilE